MRFDERLMKIVKKDLESGNIPMLLGEPGIGKSSWLTNLAKLLRTKCFVLACNQLADKADLTGARLVPITKEIVNDDGTISQVIEDYKQVFYPHEVLHTAIEYAKENPRETPILFLDELNRTTPDVTSEALSIPTQRQIGSKSIPDNLLIVIAGNDKGNITSLDEASVSRFALYHVEPDVNTFLAVNPDLNPFIKATLQAHPECIFGKKTEMAATVASANKTDDDEELSISDIFEEGDDMSQITTPRTLTGLSKWLNTFSKPELLAAISDMGQVEGRDISLLQEGIEAHVGQTLFANYLLQEIADKITTTNPTANVPTVVKPSCYDSLKACQDITSLNSLLTNLTDNEKSGTMVYALWEKEDNTVLIKALAPITQTLLPEDARAIMGLASENKLDAQNTAVLSSINCPLATNLSMILEMAG